MAKKRRAEGNRPGEIVGTSANDDDSGGQLQPVGAAQSDRLKGRAELIQAVTGLPQLTGLIVLVVESILLAALYKSETSDPTRIWYIIAALFFFVLLLVVLVVDRYLQRGKVATRDAVREAAVDQALDSLGKQLSVRYGLSAELTSIRVEILDLAGNTRITRSWKGLSVRSDFQIPYLPGKIWADNPGRITSPALEKAPRFRTPLLAASTHLRDACNNLA